MSKVQYPKGLKRDRPEPIKFPVFKPTSNNSKSISYEYGFDAVDTQDFQDCTCNGSAGAFEFFLKKRRNKTIEVSRLAPYYQAKADNPSREDMSDDGCYVSDVLSVYVQHGYVLESDWAYTQSNLLVPVPANLWKNDFELQQIVNVPNDVDSMKLALRQHGPLIIGTNWAYEWEDGVGSDGVLPAPASVAGGHCVVIVGSSDTKSAFRIRNSWGTAWADNGYCWLPYSYATLYPDYWPTDNYTVRA